MRASIPNRRSVNPINTELDKAVSWEPRVESTHVAEVTSVCCPPLLLPLALARVRQDSLLIASFWQLEHGSER